MKKLHQYSDIFCMHLYVTNDERDLFTLYAKFSNGCSLVLTKCIRTDFK